MFHVGQKVVCVKVEGDDGRFGLRVNDIYTISNLMMGYSGRPVCDVAEIKTIVPGAWHVGCFRPVIKRKTDISIFTALLNPKKVNVDA